MHKMNCVADWLQNFKERRLEIGVADLEPWLHKKTAETKNMLAYEEIYEKILQDFATDKVENNK